MHLIMSDPGLIMMVREHFQRCTSSVQANAVNWATVKFLAKHGLNLVIFVPRISIEEIEEIKTMPGMEIGSFMVHYAWRILVVAYFQGYMNKRDAIRRLTMPVAGIIKFTMQLKMKLEMLFPSHTN